MPWSLHYTSTDRVLTLKVEGPFTADDLVSMTRDTYDELRKEHALRVLLDYSTAVAKVSIPEIYKLPDLYAELRAPRHAHLALVISADDNQRETFQFYEDLAVNRGIFAKLFDDAATAKAWLLEFKDR
ncbi:MAG TPA: hypothetical protein VFM15_01045 [Gammaproteobacteria bacterium]|nr:hypothetical protein [Gammaproteobacteria bacterium]